MKFLSILFAVKVALLCAPCSKGNDLEAQLKQVDLLDPRKTVGRLAENGNLMLYGVHEFALVIPGAEPYSKSFLARVTKVQEFPGTSDIGSEGSPYHQRLAFLYCEEFNREVMHYIRKSDAWVSNFPNWESLAKPMNKEFRFEGSISDLLELISERIDGRDGWLRLERSGSFPAEEVVISLAATATWIEVLELATTLVKGVIEPRGQNVFILLQ